MARDNDSDHDSLHCAELEASLSEYTSLFKQCVNVCGRKDFRTIGISAFRDSSRGRLLTIRDVLKWPYCVPPRTGRHGVPSSILRKTLVDPARHTSLNISSMSD